MANYTYLYTHLIWGTWDRLPLITAAVESRLYGAIRAKSAELSCELIAIGGVSDHIHVLVDVHPTVAVARLVGEMKGASSHAMSHAIASDMFFKWQGGYSALSVSVMIMPRVKVYIQDQRKHHAEGSLISAMELHS